MNFYNSSKKNHQSKSTNSNLDQYSPTNKQGHLYQNMHKRNQKITSPADDQQKPSDFMTPEKTKALRTTIPNNKNILSRSTQKLDNSSNSTTVNKPSNPSARYLTHHNYPTNDLRSNNTGIKIKNHKPTPTTLRINKKTEPRFIPESIFIHPLPSQKITTVINNIDHHSSNLTSKQKRLTIQIQIQMQHDPKIIKT